MGRRCNTCKKLKPVSAFYRSRYDCKECAKARSRKNRGVHLKEVREYDRKRSHEPARQEANRKAVRKYRERLKA